MGVQEDICDKYGAPFVKMVEGETVGVSQSFLDGEKPLNGLRHHRENGTSGWYLWGGKKLKQDDDFFKPLHVEHLLEKDSEVVKFLGLAPGWRFLIADGHEDVWEDKTLLNEKEDDQ